MRQAYLLIRAQPYYRRDAFAAGLRAAGCSVTMQAPARYDSDTLLVIWNRYNHHDLACRVDAAGGTVLVAENGYLGKGGGTPKFDVHEGQSADHYYALAIGGHNGSGRWHCGGPERFAALGVELQPWRTDGEHVLICPSRNFGRPDMLMPSNWVEKTACALRRITQRPIRIRAHPGNDRPKRELDEDLQGAWAVVVWASSAGVHALVRGIPVICGAPWWICKGAAFSGLDKVELLHDAADGGRFGRIMRHARQGVFERLAWAQWTVTEIASGEPFRHLLSHARQSQSCPAV